MHRSEGHRRKSAQNRQVGCMIYFVCASLQYGYTYLCACVCVFGCRYRIRIYHKKYDPHFERFFAVTPLHSTPVSVGPQVLPGLSVGPQVLPGLTRPKKGLRNPSAHPPKKRRSVGWPRQSGSTAGALHSPSMLTVRYCSPASFGAGGSTRQRVPSARAGK